MIKYILITSLASLLFTSCISITYNKRKFKKFIPIQSQDQLIKKNGYYFYETEIYRYDNYVKSKEDNSFHPTDSILKKSATGMIFYDSNKVYVMMNYFDGLKHDEENSLKIALNKLEKRIDKFNLTTIDKRKNHISTLGKYETKNDTITIQYFRFSQGDRYLTELKGVINDSNSFKLFQRVDFSSSLFTKPKPKIKNMTYKFNQYKN